MNRHFACALVALAAMLALPVVASAYSGSIGNPRPSLDSYSVYLDYSVTFDRCSASGFCGWYPHAWQVPASSPCFVDKSYLTYVGNYQGASGTQTGTDNFYPHYTPARICLYVSGPDDQEYLIADYVYPGGTSTPAAPAPTPAAPVVTPTPAPVDEVSVAPLTISDARLLAPDALRRKFKSRFASSTLTRACYRLTTEKVRCRVAWKKNPFKYSGTVTLWNDPSA
jgi:hypothetical protein